MSDDPLSDVLRLAEASSVVSGGFIAGGVWALRFPPPNRLKFSAVARGTCWLRVDGVEPAVLLQEGDVVVLDGRRGFVVANDLATPTQDAYRVLATKRDGFAEVGNGARGECVILSGMMALNPASGALLTDVLPDIVHVRAVSPRAAPLRWIVEQILEERSSSQPGAAVASTQLAQLLFVQVLRAHAASAGTLPSSWLRAISDERLAPALRLMHGEPRRTWTLDELARATAMSRTTFATRFKAVAGVAPLAYLAQWRMRLAQHSLRQDDSSIAEIGANLGYTSESAFSNAFKRVTGAAPRDYRSVARRAPEIAERSR